MTLHWYTIGDTVADVQYFSTDFRFKSFWQFAFVCVECKENAHH